MEGNLILDCVPRNRSYSIQYLQVARDRPAETEMVQGKDIGDRHCSFTDIAMISSQQPPPISQIPCMASMKDLFVQDRFSRTQLPTRDCSEQMCIEK